MLLIALVAIDGPRAVRLEWNLRLFTALRASYIRHLSRAAAKTASAAPLTATSASTATISIFSLEHLNSLSFCTGSKNRPCHKNISTNHFEATECSSISMTALVYEPGGLNPISESNPDLNRSSPREPLYHKLHFRHHDPPYLNISPASLHQRSRSNCPICIPADPLNALILDSISM